MQIDPKRTAAFWARVAVGEPDECWPWLGGCNNSGYGNIVYDGRCRVAHRVAYFLAKGGISLAAPTDRKGTGFLKHSCDNPPCCNPAHLSVGTVSENLQEAYDRGRKVQPKGENHANAKLTNAEAVLMRLLYAAGDEDTVTLAKIFGVSQHCAWLVVNHRTYKNAA